MKAIRADRFGEPDVLRVSDVPMPEAKAGELLVRVRATALNRADLLQRRGKYPPPPGVTDVLGLEMAGEVARVGAGVTGFGVGDRVCALLPGGGYAQYAAIPAGMAMRLPERLSFEEGAAIPEAFLTAYLNLWRLGGLKAGQRVLIHAAASGVGTAAVQLAREAGATSYVTAGSAEKLAAAKSLGASAGWNYRDGSFREWLLAETNGEGVHIALDFVGAPYFDDHLATLAIEGRLVVVGTMGGADVPGLPLGKLMARRLHVIGTTLRSRPVADKIELTQEFAAFALPRFADGRLRAVIDSVYEFEDAAAAHRRMESNANIGKIVLRVP